MRAGAPPRRALCTRELASAAPRRAFAREPGCPPLPTCQRALAPGLLQCAPHALIPRPPNREARPHTQPQAATRLRRALEPAARAPAPQRNGPRPLGGRRSLACVRRFMQRLSVSRPRLYTPPWLVVCNFSTASAPGHGTCRLPSVLYTEQASHKTRAGRNPARESGTQGFTRRPAGPVAGRARRRAHESPRRTPAREGRSAPDRRNYHTGRRAACAPRPRGRARARRAQAARARPRRRGAPGAAASHQTRGRGWLVSYVGSEGVVGHGVEPPCRSPDHP